MSSILFPESVLLSSNNRKRVIRELVQGKEYATELKFMLQKPTGSNNGSSFSSAEDLLSNVLRSFADTLSLLTSSSAVGQIEKENGSQQVDANSCNDLRSQDSSKSKKRSLTNTKDRRGCYKRRRTEQTWAKVSQTTEDNHAWRKYGQKEILNTKFPRCYFRCTRKYDQGCRAIKQVQRIQENPDLYQITYIGSHTCKDTVKAPQMDTYSDNTCVSFLVNFHHDSKVLNEQDPLISSQTPIIKHEHPKDDLDPSLWSDLKDFELSKPTIVPLKMTSDNADTVYSCTDSQSLDMDFGFSSHFISTDFHFDESHLL